MMSNTKQQIEEMISDFGEDSISYGEELHAGRVKSDDEIKSDSAELLRKQTEIVEAIDRLVTEARLDPFDFVESCEPECTPERHAYHQGQWDMAKRITELQSQLTNKEDQMNDSIPKSTIKALIEVVKTLNLEFYCREDCKNCVLMEQLEEML
jgi:Txe/YoeB family toxin of Txe-Axe toxin-antitoxin module